MAAVTQPIRLFLVEDHELVRHGIHAIFSEHPDIVIVGEAETAEEAVQQAFKLQPDILLMDIRLPDGSGIEACRDILAACPAARIIILTSYINNELILAAVLAGVHGYLVKKIEANSLVRAIRHVARGDSILDPTVTKLALDRLRQHSYAPRVGPDALSPQEQRILAQIADGKTNKEIASCLNLSEKTVKNYLTHAFQKLQITRRSQAVVLYLQHQNRMALLASPTEPRETVKPSTSLTSSACSPVNTGPS